MLSLEDRVCSSKINVSDVFSEVVFQEIEVMPEYQKRREHKTLELERTLDFSLFDLPYLGTGPNAPIFVMEDGYDCFVMPKKWPRSTESISSEDEEPHSPDYSPPASDTEDMDVQIVLRRKRKNQKPTVQEEDQDASEDIEEYH